MSKILCECSHVIIDQTDFLPYKAVFTADQNSEANETEIDAICSYINAVKSNKREEWLVNYFGSTFYNNKPDDTIICDIKLRISINYERVIYQCEACGRLKVQKGNENVFITFYPEDEEWKDIFKGN